MRVGLYNRWVRTAGGGEKHSLAIAEILSRSADVDLLVPEPVDLRALGERLRLTLDRVRVRLVGPDDHAVTHASADYDLFVNATFQGVVRAAGRRNMLLVYFPHRIFEPGLPLRKARLVTRLERELVFPRYGDGFLPPEDVRRGGRWTKGRAYLHIRLPRRGPHVLELALRAPRASTAIRVHCTTGGHTSSHHLVVGPTPATHRLSLPPELEGDLDVEIESPLTVVPASHATSTERCAVGVFVGGVHVNGLRHALYRLLFERLLPSRRYVFEQEDVRYATWRALDTYQLLCANSEFTRGWIQRYWARDASVLFPPVDVEQLAPARKEPLILSVGRFFAGGHSKRHDVLVEAARRLLASLPAGWRVVLAGGVNADRPDEVRYFEAVRQAAAGLPVAVRCDVSTPELTRLYAAATIYWHAAGFSDDRTKDPITFEHFGITTVEAMAAGCVPLVFGVGGQVEIVRPGVDGYLWYDVGELVDRTRELVADPARRERMMQAAMERAARFGRAHFEDRLATLLKPLLDSMEPRAHRRLTIGAAGQ